MTGCAAAALTRLSPAACWPALVRFQDYPDVSRASVESIDWTRVTDTQSSAKLRDWYLVCMFTAVHICRRGRFEAGWGRGL